MKIFVLFVAVLSLSGCATAQENNTCGISCNSVQDDYNRLIEAEFVICQGASTGAIQRQYGEGTKYMARQLLCFAPNKFSPSITFPETEVIMK